MSSYMSSHPAFKSTSSQTCLWYSLQPCVNVFHTSCNQSRHRPPLTAEISSEPSANLHFLRGAGWCILPCLTQDLKVLKL